MALKNLLFKILLILITVGCVACGPSLQAGESEISATVTYQVQSVPRFRDMTVFPGNVTGYTLTDTVLVQVENTVCLQIYNNQLPTDWDELPLNILIDMQPVELDEIEITLMAELTNFCFSPYLEEGMHVADIDIMTASGIDSYTWDFSTQRLMGRRPYITFPGVIQGFQSGFPDPYVLMERTVCMEIPTRILPDVDYRDLMAVRINDGLVEFSLIEAVVDEEIVTYCVALNDLGAGLHEFEVELITIGSELVVSTNEGAFDYQVDAVETGAVELYGWEFVVDEE